MSEYAVAMRGITKRFPGIIANANVDLLVRPGEIHALVGENGAGKTTLMNILYGLYRPDEGELRIHDRPVTLRSPRDAIQAGIGMVHQHFMLVEPLSIVENIVLGAEPTQGFMLDRRKARAEVVRLSGEYGLKVDPDAMVEDTVVGMQQRVEIIKLLYRGADVLIFDEPTAVLTPQETEELFVILRKLAEAGKSIIFITHKLKEIKAVTQGITVMRQGRVVGHLETAQTTEAEIASMMVGREVLLRVDKAPAKPGEIRLQVEGLSARSDRGLPALRDVSLSVRGGEILGIAGVAGNGQTELAEVLTGLRAATGGKIVMEGRDITPLAVIERVQAGMAHIPEDRHKRGLVLNYSVAENLILASQRKPPFSRGVALQFPAIRENAAQRIDEFDIRTPSMDTASRSLSGGNQQKIIIAREVSRDPGVLIVVQPTRGVDVGAIEFIHRRLVEMRDEGKAILLISLELEEVLSLSDRIAVLYEGEIVGEMPAREADEQKLGLLMAGGGKAVAHGT
ncbi:MAG: ABC transporter ATP-binding protein [Candidatus Xenobia bacterium]